MKTKALNQAKRRPLVSVAVHKFAASPFRARLPRIPVNYSHAVPFTANDVGTALVMLFHEPLKPMPL